MAPQILHFYEQALGQPGPPAPHFYPEAPSQPGPSNFSLLSTRPGQDNRSLLLARADPITPAGVIPQPRANPHMLWNAESRHEQRQTSSWLSDGPKMATSWFKDGARVARVVRRRQSGREVLVGRPTSKADLLGTEPNLLHVSKDSSTNMYLNNLVQFHIDYPTGRGWLSGSRVWSTTVCLAAACVKPGLRP